MIEAKEFIEAFLASGLDVTALVGEWQGRGRTGYLFRYRLRCNPPDRARRQRKDEDVWHNDDFVTDHEAMCLIHHAVQEKLDAEGVEVRRCAGGFVPYREDLGWLCADGEWYRNIGAAAVNTYATSELAQLAAVVALRNDKK